MHMSSHQSVTPGYTPGADGCGNHCRARADLRCDPSAAPARQAQTLGGCRRHVAQAVRAAALPQLQGRPTCLSSSSLSSSSSSSPCHHPSSSFIILHPSRPARPSSPNIHHPTSNIIPRSPTPLCAPMLCNCCPTCSLCTTKQARPLTRMRHCSARSVTIMMDRRIDGSMDRWIDGSTMSTMLMDRWMIPGRSRRWAGR